MSCLVDQQCKWQFHCQEGTCEHNGVFPLTGNTIGVYVLTMLVCSLCNVSGHSMGIFKMLLLIVLLNYDLDEATGLAQAMVVGSALPNFFAIILKKHPIKPANLVNYDLIYVIIPCTLLGSTVGSLLQNFTPKIVQDGLLVALFSFMVYNFAKKFALLVKPGKPMILSQELLCKTSSTRQLLLPEGTVWQSLAAKGRSIRLGSILGSIFLYISFEFLSFLVQGKLPFYSVGKCSWEFAVGLSGLALFILVYLAGIRWRLALRFQQYQMVGLSQEIDLGRRQVFLRIASGGFTAGLIQGIIGMGCGTFIMLVLLSFPMDPTSASATSGYQILFSGLSSLAEYFINGEVDLFTSGWFIGLCAVGGGIFTIILYRVLKLASPKTVSIFLYAVIMVLCLMSVALTIVTVAETVSAQGWDSLLGIKFHC